MRWAMLVVAGLTVLGSGPARAENYKVGDKVVVIHDDVEVKARIDVADSVGRGQVFVVRDVQGEWIEIRSATTGFIEMQHVIPFDQAIGYWSGIIRSNPQDAWAYAARGIARYELKELDKAIKDFGECLRLDPKRSAAYTNRGVAWHAKGESDIAIADYYEAIRLNPKDGLSYMNRGHAWSKKTDYDKAIADYDEAIRLNPKDARAYNNRGFSWLCKGEPDNAISDYNEAIHIDAKYRLPYLVRAWTWATWPDPRYRDGKRAVESALVACELDEWRYTDINVLAAAYAEAGDFEAAVKWQTKAVDLAPEKSKADFRSRLDLYSAGKPYRQERTK